MKRVLEPEVMDGHEQSEAYAAADFAQVNADFVARFCDTFPTWTAGTCVDLGCGPADIPIRLCKRLLDIHVLAVDASKTMLALGRRALAAEELESRVTLLCAMLPLEAPLKDLMDAVISNSLLHHLPEPETLWESIKELGRPGAPVLVMDLRRPNSEQAAQELVDLHAAEAPEVLRHDFYHSLLAAFRPEEVQAQLQQAGLDRTLRVEVISDRHLMVVGHLP